MNCRNIIFADTSQNRRWFSGSIDEIGIFDRALSEEEIKLLNG